GGQADRRGREWNHFAGKPPASKIRPSERDAASRSVTLLRANPPKGGDAEPRSFGLNAMPAGPPASRPPSRPWRPCFLYIGVGRKARAHMPFTFNLSKRLARIKASVLGIRLPAVSPAGQVPTVPAILQAPRSTLYALPTLTARSRR